jgi:thymidylate synthase (FAD)
MAGYRKGVSLKIIEQGHEIISLPDNLLALIEAAGRTCYKSENKIGCTLNPDDWNKDTCPKEFCRFDPVNLKYIIDCNVNCKHHSSQKFTKMLLDKGHDAMIEFGDVTVRFVTNRGVTHELVRHRMASYAQESTRYVRYDGGMEFIRPVWVLESYAETTFLPEDLIRYDRNNPEHIFVSSCIKAEIAYKTLLGQGWRPEQAREVLPNSLKTEICMKANIREWRHIFQLRCSKKAHPQIRALMLSLLAELKQKLPVVFDDIYSQETVNS